MDGGGDRGVLGRDRARPLGELLGAEVVGRGVLQVAGAVDGRRDDAGALRLAAVAADQGERRELAGPLGRGRGQVAVEPVVAEQRALDQAAGGEVGLERDGIDDEGHGRCPGGGGRAGAERRRMAHIVGGRRLAQADDRHPAGADAAVGVDDRHLAAGAADLAGVDQALERSSEGLVDLRRGALEHRRL